jgi:hypothetical protein
VGQDRFRKIFKRTVEACLKTKIATGEIVHIDASLIRANVSWGRSPDWIKMKNPASEAVRREAEEDWGR